MDKIVKRVLKSVHGKSRKKGGKTIRSLNFLAIAVVLFLFSRSVSAVELTWTGCDITEKAFMREVAQAYEEKTGVKIRLSGGGATKGIRAVAAGASDMGGTCRHRLVGPDGAIHKDEKGVVLIQVAWDAIVPAVHKDNPVGNISLSDLKKIYEGKITSWKRLGGEERKIVLLTREEQEKKYSGVESMLRWLVFNNPEYEFKARSLSFKSTTTLIEKLRKTPAGFAVTGISSVGKEKGIKAISLDGISPTREHIASGSYPLFRPLYLVVRENNKNPEVKKFIDFVLGPEGQAVIGSQGTITLQEGAALVPLWNRKKVKLKIK